jgi:transposase
MKQSVVYDNDLPAGARLFAGRIKEFSGQTNRQIAEAMGVSWQTVSRWKKLLRRSGYLLDKYSKVSTLDQ